MHNPSSEIPQDHKAGFVNIIGKPNVGKSTLVNALIGEPLSVITPKAQTTRHRIKGILNGENYQIIFSDTPGIVENPGYAMHKAMNQFVKSAFEDADILLWVVDATRPKETLPKSWLEAFNKLDVTKFVVLNKVDAVDRSSVEAQLLRLKSQVQAELFLDISATTGYHLPELLQAIIDHLPNFPPYYPKDETLSDLPLRFFIAEMIREQIFFLYREEIPYSTEVVIETFKEPDDESKHYRIRAIIYVARPSQKHILIGKGGQAIKQLGIRARQRIEHYLGAPVYLELYVKVLKNWRDDQKLLQKLGYPL